MTEEAEVVAPFDTWEISAEPMLKHFRFEHLPPHLRAVSQMFAKLARDIVRVVPRDTERTTALRKLLEAKDCAVRAMIP